MAHILVIDDDASIRYLIRMALEHYGYEVSEAENGYEGLQRYRSESPDLVITDMQMPVMDGLQLLTELQGELPMAKVIAVSGGSRVLEMAKVLNVQCAFTKPFVLKDLLHAVQALIPIPEMAGQRQEAAALLTSL